MFQALYSFSSAIASYAILHQRTIDVIDSTVHFITVEHDEGMYGRLV